MTMLSLFALVSRFLQYFDSIDTFGPETVKNITYFMDVLREKCHLDDNLHFTASQLLINEGNGASYTKL